MTPLEIVLGGVLVAVLVLWVRDRRIRSRARSFGEEQRALHESMRRCLDHLAEGVVLVDPRAHVLYANAAALTLLRARAAADGERRPALRELSTLPLVADVVERARPHDTVRQVVEVPEDEDGPGATLELTLAPAGPDRQLLVLQDLRAGAAVERKRRDFVANASHELKTPIAALIGLLDLVDEVPASERSHLLERARLNAQGLSNMANDLLGLARAEDPDWRPSPVRVDPRRVLGEVADELSARAADKGLEFDVRLDPGLGPILVDRVSLATVVRNLVTNAIVYTERGRVELEAGPAESGGGVVVEVRDTGPGIDPEILPSIFERFFRGDVVHSRASGGTGLGLSIVRNLLRRMGGRISVRSRPGEGSVFRVELPRSPAEPLAGAGQAEFN